MNKRKMESMQKRIRLETQKKVIELLKSEDYYIWLNNFTKEMPIFADVKDLDVIDDDAKNVQNLYVFYKMIEDYANSKNISVSSFEKGFGIYYSIINLGIPYEIGFSPLNGSFVHFCNRCDIDENKNFIDISNIRKEYFLKKEQELEKLEGLKNLVIRLLDSGIESEQVLSFVNNGIKEGKQKQLARTFINTD